MLQSKQKKGKGSSIHGSVEMMNMYQVHLFPKRSYAPPSNASVLNPVSVCHQS